MRKELQDIIDQNEVQDMIDEIEGLIKDDYALLVASFQRHTRCRVAYCLR